MMRPDKTHRFSERAFQNIIDQSYSGISLLDENFNVFYRSPSVERITGWRNVDSDSIALSLSVHADNRNSVKETLENLLKTPGESAISVFQFTHAKGHLIWLECVFTNMLENPDVRAIICNYIDVTARINAEQQLRETMDELSAYKYALDESAIVAVTDQKGTIRHVNDQFVRISGYSREELIGNDHRIINSGFHDKSYIKELWRKIAAGEVWSGELKNKAKDGSYYWVDTSIIPFLNDRGKPYQYVAIRSDITERKNKEEHLKLLESVVTNTTDAVLITTAGNVNDPDPIIIYANEAFEKMCGYTPDEVVGRSPKFLQGAKTDRDELDRLKSAMEKGESYEALLINYKKNGEEFWNQFSVSPVFGISGQTSHFIAIERDVTRWKNDQLQKALLTDITLTFASSADTRESLTQVLRQLVNFGNFWSAEALLLGGEGQLELFTQYSPSGNALAFLHHTTSNKSFSKGEGLPGRTWESGEIQYWRNIGSDPMFLRNEDARKYGLKSAYGIPLSIGGGFLGVLVLGLDRDENQKDIYTGFFEKYGTFLSLEIKRKQLEYETIQLFNSVPDVICVVNINRQFKKVNPAMCNLLEYSQQELHNMTISDLIHPDDLQESLDRMKDFQLQDGLTLYFENRYLSKSGKIKHLSWTATKEPEKNELFCVAKDITEKKELFIEKNNILESIGDAFFAIDRNWIVTYWNYAAAEILKRSKEEMLGKNLWESFNEAIGSASHINYQEAMDSGRPVHFEDFFHPLQAWFEISAYPSDKGLSVFFKDITERVTYIKTIEDHNKKLTEISWIQSHVVRAPLSRIMGLVGLLKLNDLSKDEKQEMLDYLMSAANELDDVVKNITSKTHQ